MKGSNSKKLYAVSSSYERAILFARDRGVNRKDCYYVHSIDRIRGRNGNGKYIHFIGEFWNI